MSNFGCLPGKAGGFPILLSSCIDGQLALIGLPRWAQCGFPEVQLAETYAAALLATIVSDEVLTFVRAPFPVFLLEVPNALLSLDTESGPSPVRWILVQRQHGESEKWAYIAWTASSACLWRFGVKTEDLLPATVSGWKWSETSPFPMTVTAQDERVASLIGRLIINTCLAMSDPERVRAPVPRKAKAPKPWERRDSPVPKTTVYRVGTPIQHDFRPAVSDYLAGKRRTLSVQTLVAGHWKMQAHGPALSLRKLIYVMPYWRGDAEAPIHVRPIRLG